jgi:heptosyltransferase III
MTARVGGIDSESRVLVIFPGALGDFVCMLPAIEALTTRHRGCSIELIARAELVRLAVGRTCVARGHSIDDRRVSRLFSEAGEIDPEVRKFFGVYNRIYSFFTSTDAGFRNRLAAATEGEVSFHPFRPVDDGSVERHIAAAYLRSIGEVDARMESRIEPTAEDLGAALEVIARLRCDRSNLIAIFPGSGSPAKNWPLDKFLMLAKKLSESASVVFILGPAESAMEETIRESNLPVLKDLELGTVAGIARRARCFVGNDSGVSHLAAATGASGVVIFGPTDPKRWRPLGRVAVLGREEITSDYPDVTPDEVAVAVNQVSFFRGSQQGEKAIALTTKNTWRSFKIT